MRKIRRTMCVLLAVIMLWSMAMPALAVSKSDLLKSVTASKTAETTATSGNPLSIEIITDKSSYKATGTAKINVKVTNTGNEAVENVSAEALCANLAPVGKDSKLTAEAEKLNSGESLEFSYQATIKISNNNLNFFQKIGLFFKRLFMKKIDVKDNGFDNGRESTEKQHSIQFGKFSVNNTIRVWYGKNTYVEFENLDKSPFQADVGKTTKMTFTVSVNSNIEIENKEIDLYVDDKNSEKLNDNGLNGDETANDGVYSGTISLYSNIRKDVEFFVQYKEYKSKTDELYFYNSPTESEMQEIDNIYNDIREIKSKYMFSTEFMKNNENEAMNKVQNCYNEINDYLKNRSDIKEFGFDSGTMSFFILLKNGVTIGSGSLRDLQTDEKKSTKSALRSLDKNNSSMYNGNANANQNLIETLQPYYSQMTTSAYDNSAYYISDKMSNYSFSCALKNEEVTVETMKNLSKYRVTILNGHGGNWSTHRYVIALSEKPTEQNLKKYKASDDYGKTILDNDGYYVVTEKFFDRYYNNGDLDNTVIYLGTCFGGDDNVGIRDILRSKGAEAVFSYKNTVVTLYNEKMVKTIFEQMAKGKTANSALKEAKKKNGDHDPYISSDVYENLGFWERFGYALHLIESSAPAELVLSGNNTEVTLSSIKNNECFIRGQVIDKVTKKPIENAKITCTDLNFSCLSDKYGIFRISTPSNKNSFKLEISKQNYKTAKITFAGYSNEYINVELEPNECNVSGTVKDKNTNQPIDNVEVEFRDKSSNTLYTTAKTNNNGAFSARLPYGDYILSFKHDSYISYTTTEVHLNVDNYVILNPILLTYKNNINSVYLIKEAYKGILIQYSSPYIEFGEKYYNLYTVYDIDKNGVPELIIRKGNSEAAYMFEIYTYNNGVVHLGELGGGHTALYGNTNEKGIYAHWAHMGVEGINIIYIENGKLMTKEYLPPREVGSGSYTHLDNYLEEIDVIDYSLIYQIS